MQKRGWIELPFTIMIDLVLIAIIMGILFFFLSDVGSNTYFKKSYLARDMSLTLGAVQARPGSVYYTYSRPDLKDFTISMEKGLVSIYREKKELPGSYGYYADNKSLVQLSEIKAKDEIFFAGCPGGLSVSDEYKRCPQACPKADKGQNSILAVGVLSLPSTELSKGVQAKHAEEVAEYIVRSQRTFLQAQILKEQTNHDLILLIKSEPSEEYYAKITYQLGSARSEAMACRVSESLKSKFPGLKVSRFPGKNPLFFKDKAGMIIELGSTSVDGVMIPKDIPQTAGAINSAIGGFYAG